MTKIEKNDFVTIEYTGILKESGQIFDTTSEQIAKKENIHNMKMAYGPITICVGQNQILKAIDENLLGKEEKAEFLLDLNPENAFGKKNAKLIKLVPSNIFKKQNIQPFVGLEVQLDSMPGIIRSVSGGRILVDFNHPLAGRDVKYDIKVNKKVDDIKEKIKAYLQITFGVKETKITVSGDKAEIEMQLPLQISKTLAEKIREVIPELRTIEFLSKNIENTKDKKADNN